jgi:hypothetical protein
MKLSSLLAVLAISALTFAVALPAKAQGGGGGGQGGGQRRGGRGFGPQTPWSLVNRDDVKKDIQLTDDEKTKLDAAQADMRSKMQEMRQNGGQGGDRAAMMAAFQKMQEEYATTVKGILTPAQQDRLVQIYIQLNGSSAVANADVQKKLNLPAETVAKIKALQDAQQKANADLRAKAQSGEIDRAQIGELMQKNNEIMKTELEKVLTDDEKAKLKAAGGAPFTADAPPAGGQ